jgi:hypothetical protein
MPNGSKWCRTALLAVIAVTTVSASQPSPKAAVYAALFNDRHWDLEPLAQLVVKRTSIPEANWQLFQRQFAAAGWAAFSDIYFASDDAEALVYYEGRCGSAYGVGMYVWLHRGSAESDWIIRKRIVSWVS